ncbi:ATPase [Methanobrevibacter sp.]|uniref:ATPase n=1 Tax=Methanobrevibacter sp. TaxID=66852 RepID=UPI003890D635
MECYYHPEREGTDKCAICGKNICKECGLELAGKTYCKECLEKIVGLSLDNKSQETDNVVAQEPVQTQTSMQEPIDETIYQPQEESKMEIPYTPEDQSPYSKEFNGIGEDSPYNIKDNIVSNDLDQSNLEKSVTPQIEQPQVAQNEFDYEPEKQVLTPEPTGEDDFIYPDHSYEPQTTSARQELEDKYEKYLDDLYFDDDVPLNEQLAKDEEQFGSLTKKEYKPRKEDVVPQEVQTPGTPKPKYETPEEMEARIRAEILNEQKGKSGHKIRGKSKSSETNIHNINYKDEKEPMGAIDIVLTIVLIIVILVVVYYLLYLFILHASYPTFMDAVYGLKTPQNVINNILTK